MPREPPVTRATFPSSFLKFSLMLKLLRFIPKLAIHSNVGTYVGNSDPACSDAMYLEYQSGQFSSLCPVRCSCLPCAASARRRAFARSLAEPKEVVAESIRPASRVVISCNTQPLPSGSRNDANEL